MHGMLLMNQHRVVRQEVNELDKSTVVSIFPKEVNEHKPTISPGYFHISPGSLKNPQILVVGSSSWWRELDETMPYLEIVNNSIQVARSVVNDYCSGILGSDMVESMPGLFFVKGEVTLLELQDKKYAAQFKDAERKQTNMFKVLIRLADIAWSRSNGNPLTISDDMRIAATELNLDKPWNKDAAMLERIACKACGTMITSDIIICPNCKVVLNPSRFKEMSMEFAK
jgi:hypothetical protein